MGYRVKPAKRLSPNSGRRRSLHGCSNFNLEARAVDPCDAESEVTCRLLWFEGTLGYSPEKGPLHVMLTSTGASAASDQAESPIGGSM